MTAKQLLMAIGDIDEKLISEAEPSAVTEAGSSSLTKIESTTSIIIESGDEPGNVLQLNSGSSPEMLRMLKYQADRKREEEAKRRKRRPIALIAAGILLIIVLGIAFRFGLFSNNRGEAVDRQGSNDKVSDASGRETGGASAMEEKDNSTSDNSTGSANSADASSPKLSARAEGSQGSEKSEISDFDSVSQDRDEMSAAIANPFIRCENMREASAIAGFNFAVPGSISLYQTQVIFAIPNDFIEVIYYDTKEIEGLRIRKCGNPSESISGDYNEYDLDYFKEIDDSDGDGPDGLNDSDDSDGLNGSDAPGDLNGPDATDGIEEDQGEGGEERKKISVHLMGNGSRIYTAEWSREDASYAIDVGEAILDEEGILELVQEIK